VPRPIEISPSVLPADFARLGDECRRLADAGAHRIHWDVMDGVFVPNLTLGPDVIASIRPHVDIPFEAHLMVVNPDQLAHRYVEAGCSTVMVHVEACDHLHRSLGNIRELGARSGAVLNPHTPAVMLENVLDMVDHILVMSVNPGFGGQSYLSSVEPKVAQVAAMVAESGHDIDIEVDGGIGAATIGAMAAAGANVFVAGSALFNDPDGPAHAISTFVANAEAARH